jgi:thymidylate synthase (FAD)
MTLQLIAQTTGQYRYADHNSEELIAAIARHGKIKEDNGKLVRYLMDNRHWSPLDMINFVFQIETSRAIGRELLRHRSMCFQETSQRYEKRVDFEPFQLRKQAEHNRQSSTEVFDPVINVGWEAEMKASEAIEKHLAAAYRLNLALLNAGVARECARFILPEATTTTIHANGTLRSWLAFLNVRLDKAAQKEIQDIARAIGGQLESQLPNVFAAIDWRNGLFM